jgi:large subunit ribosomal protein L9
MRVILLEDIKDLGKKYEIKEVKDGYARNSLLPKSLVKIADAKAIKWLEGQKETESNKAEI